MRHVTTAFFASVCVSLVLLFGLCVPSICEGADVLPGSGGESFPQDVKTWDWGPQHGQAFPPANGIGNWKSHASALLAEGWHIRQIRVATGGGLDAVAFTYGRTHLVDGLEQWDEKERRFTDELNYRNEDYLKFLRDGKDGAKIGWDEGENKLRVIDLLPNERLDTMTILCGTGHNVATDGIKFHIVALTGGDRTEEVSGDRAKWDQANGNNSKTIGKTGSEIVQVKVYTGKQVDAIGVRYRARP